MNSTHAIVPLSVDEQITCSMASMPSRLDGMLTVLTALLPQCDRFFISLNDYPAISHPLLENPRVTIIHSAKAMGARGKMLMTTTVPGYHLTVDDDIQYPPDYCMTMVRHVETMHRQAIVGAHGKIVFYRRPPQPLTFRVLNFAEEIRDYSSVHIMGTGTMAWHSSLVQFDADALEPGKIDDQIALYCQQNFIPMVVVPHPAGWMGDMAEISVRDALRKNFAVRKDAIERIAAYPSWRFYIP